MVRKIGVHRDPRNKQRPWVARWFGEQDPATGKRRRYAKSFRLKVAAEQFAAKKVMEFQGGGFRDKPEKVTLKEFLHDWLKIKRPDYQIETLRLYENAIGRLLDYFGPHTELGRITPRSAAKFIAELNRKDGRDGELSGWSRARTLRNAKTIFSAAVGWGLIAKNPFSHIKRPKLTAKRWHYLTAEQFTQLLNAQSGKHTVRLRHKVIYSLAYCCGLRLGEITNLMWNDIDFDKGDIRIESRPATAENPPFVVKDKEARQVPMPEHLLNLLVDLKSYNDATDQTPYVALTEQQHQTAVKKWKEYQQQKRGWVNRDMQNNTLTTFKRHVRWAEIGPDGSLSLHTLRKACITNWANSVHNPEVVRQLAGHSDIKTTAAYYLKVTEEQRLKAAAAIDGLLKTDVKVTYENK